MINIQQLSIQDAEILVNNNSFLHDDTYEGFTVQLLRKVENQDLNTWHVEVVILYNGQTGSSPIELEEFCREYKKPIYLRRFD